MLPSLLPSKLDERLLLVCIVLGLLLAAAGAKIVRLQEALDAKPAVTEHRAIKEERGPVVTVRRYAPPPAPTVACPRPAPVLLEEVVTAGPVKREETFAHSEVPSHALAPKKYPRWAYLDFDPASRTPYVPVGARLGMDISRASVGAWYYRPSTAFGGTVGFRF